MDTPITVIVAFDNDTELVVDLSTDEWESLSEVFGGLRAFPVWRGVSFAEEAIFIRLGRVLSIRTA